MQTSEHIIAYQTVSSSAYKRLRETLLQQTSAFDSVEQAESFVLMRSAALNVLLTAVRLSEESPLTKNSHTAQGQQATPEKSTGANLSPEGASAEYRVGLTFDDQAIAVFTQRLRPGHLRPEQMRPEEPHQSAYFPAREFSPSSIGAEKANASAHNLNDAIAQEDKLIAQKSFVLGWAKNLAVSPEGDTQPTQTALENQLQQSLLLDQVITRIRHSLDLPAILETTVAQVREFLSADRLVLYQFDQFDLTGDEALRSKNRAEDTLDHWFEAESDAVMSSTLIADPQPSTHSHVHRNSSHSNHHIPSQHSGASGTYTSGAHASVVQPSAAYTPSAERAPKVGRSAFSGHVTYESRVSADIPTVLHLSEKQCFSTSQSQRHARYLLGQPIAIDNVDEAYKDVTCLLDFLHQAGVKSKIIAPIIVQDNVWGLLVAHQCHNYRHWEKTEAVFLQHIAEHLAVAISQASLYQQLRQQTVNLESCVIERTQSLHDALIAAESASLSKDEFLSTMSHELRTPLTYIIGMSATLLRWSLGELNDRQRSYLKTINQSGEQLLKVINDILEFASVESGRSLLDASWISINQFIGGVVANHQAMAENQEVSLSLHVDLSKEEDWVEADAKRLQQIIDNLVHNAIKFTGAGGKVQVRVWREQQAVVFEVEDTGIGIPDSQRDELFQKFKQLESPFQRQHSGTGLGLAMTKRLVEMHSGTIHVRSQVAKGSTFTVRLPANGQQAERSSKQTKSLEQALETTPGRVVLLEDDEDNAAIACEMLTAAGYEVIWLIEAKELADQLGSLKPALLIADLSMLSPSVGNLKAIQHTITALDTKVLAISTEQSFNHSTMAHHDILNKPLDPKALISKVKQLA